MPERRILTLHMPLPAGVMDQLLTAVETALHGIGAGRVWIDPASSHDLVVLADLPDTAGEADAEVAAALGDALAAEGVPVPVVPEPREGAPVRAD